jgi:hypothetical protein
MMGKKMGAGQNKKLKADFGRDKQESLGPEEKRELARRQGSSKKRQGKT